MKGQIIICSVRPKTKTWLKCYQQGQEKKCPFLKVLKCFIFEAGQRRNQFDLKFVLNQKEKESWIFLLLLNLSFIKFEIKNAYTINE